MSESAPSELAFRIVIAADIQRVWRELTKTGEAQGAVFNAWLHTLGGVVPGAAMQMRTASGKHTLVVGEVLECQPPHRFVHTHRFTQYDDPVGQVSYELKEVPGGVQVTLRVTGVVSNSKTAKDTAFRIAIERISGEPLDEGFENWGMARGHALGARFGSVGTQLWNAPAHAT